MGDPVSVNTRQTRTQLSRFDNPHDNNLKPYFRRSSDFSMTSAQQNSKGDSESFDALMDTAVKLQHVQLLANINQNVQNLQNQNATIINLLTKILQLQK